MVSFKILSGGYASYIATYLFTIEGNKASLSVSSRSPSGDNPSWIAGHPTNKSLIYATNEPWPLGFIQSFGLKADGSLSAPLSTASTGGDAPAHALVLSNGLVVAMNYNTGDGTIFNVTTEGGKLSSDRSQYISFPKATGEISHPHQAYEHNKELFIPDLGLDTIWRLTPTNGGSEFFKLAGGISQPKGGGPRHMEIYGDRMFVLHELSSRLTLQKIPALGSSKAEIIADVSIVPTDGPSDAQWAASEILIPPPSPKFPIPYVYVSNRNKGPTKDPRGDSVAIFEHVGKGTRYESLKLVKQVYTDLDLVRGMAFGPKDVGRYGLIVNDEYLIAGASDGAKGVAVFQRINGGRDLKMVARDSSIGTRTSFLWV